MKEAIKYIKLNWKEGKSLKEIALLFKVNPGNLERAFRLAEGVTVKSFIDKKRKEYVLAALRADKTLGYQLGEELGFRSDRAFYRWVQRVFGLSYRQLYAAEKSSRNT